MVVNKKVSLDLEGLDGNAFAILSAFRKQCKIEKWTDAEINSVMTEAQSDDYDHLLQTIMKYCE